MSANFFHLQPSILSVTATPTCCCLYSTGVWKQAPTHFLSLFRQAVWHPAYHLPQDFMLRIIQLLVCLINCLLCPTECQALVIKTLLVWCPINWHGKDFPLDFTTGQDLERPSKTLHVSISCLYCSRTPKYQKQAPFTFMKTCPESRTRHKSPDCRWHHPLMRRDPSKILGTDLVHRKVLLSCRFKMPSVISQDWRKSTAQLSEGDAGPDLYAVASCTTWCAFSPGNWQDTL